MRLFLALPSARQGEELLGAQAVRVESVQEVFEAHQSLCVGHPSCNGGYVAALHALQLHKHTQMRILTFFTDKMAEE